MKGWIDWPTHTGYWWYRKKNGAPKLVAVFEERGGGIECWECPGTRRFYQYAIKPGVYWKPVASWKDTNNTN